jgi:hypothetical protein
VDSNVARLESTIRTTSIFSRTPRHHCPRQLARFRS